MNRDRNLLYGVLAVQLRKITPAQLVEVAAAWLADPSRDLPDRFEAGGHIAPEDRHLLDAFVNEAVRAYGGSVETTLANLAGPELIREAFGEELSASLKPLATTVPGTPPPMEHVFPLGDVPAVNETPGRYTHASEYARGGMGRVLLVRDQHLGRNVALKELLPDPDADTLQGDTPVRQSVPAMARFLQEARITGQLEHPGIVPVYELGYRRDGTLYYTMKLVRGRTLGRALAEAAGLAGRLAYLSNYLDLCQAIAYAHSRKVNHRDIKPLNVMVGEFGETVVLDWGLAKVRDKTDAAEQDLRDALESLSLGHLHHTDTANGRAIGTPHYMPPEQARGDVEHIDERSDVYSLGAVLYELLTGHPPFHDVHSGELVQRLLYEDPVPVASLVPDAPPELAAICHRALAKDPNDRYPSARALAEDVRRFLTGALVGAYSYTFKEHLARFVRRNRHWIATGAVASVALVAMAAYSYWRIAREHEETERQLYYSSIHLASESIDNRRFDIARQALDRAPEKWRDWEWGYYDRLCRLEEHTLVRHDRAVVEVEYSPDGKTILTASDDRTARTWAAATGEPLHTLAGHTNEFRCARFSRDGRLIATASLDGSAMLWESATGKQLQVLGEHTDTVWTVDFHPWEPRLVTASSDGTAKIWDLGSGAVLLSLDHPKSLVSAAFSPSGDTVLTVSDDGAARLWNAETGQLLRTVSHGDPLGGAAFSGDGTRFLTWSPSAEARARDSEIRIWETANSDTAPVVHTASGRLRFAAFNGGATLVAATYLDGTAEIIDVRNGQLVGRLDSHDRGPLIAVFTPDGSRIVTVSEDRLAKLWRLGASNPSPEVTLAGHWGSLTDAAISPDSTHLVTASKDGTAKIWNLDRPALPAALTLTGHRANVTQLRTFPPAGERKARAVSAGNDGLVRIWEPSTGRDVLVLNANEAVQGMDLWESPGKPEKRLVVAGLTNGTIRLWDGADGRSLAQWSGHSAPVRTVRFDGSGARVVSASMDGTARVWFTARPGDPPLTLSGHTGDITSACFSPDGKWIVTSSADETARLWNAESGEAAGVLSGHTQSVEFACFTPDGRHVVTGSQDGFVRVWSAQSRQSVHVLAGHRQTVIGGAFSPDNRTLATWSYDGTVRLWDWSRGELLHILRGHDKPVIFADFRRDGRRLVTVSLDQTARLWDTETGVETVAIPLPDRGVAAVFSADDDRSVLTASGSVLQVWRDEAPQQTSEKGGPVPR